MTQHKLCRKMKVFFRNHARPGNNNNHVSPANMKPIGCKTLIEGFNGNNGLKLADWLSRQRGFDVLLSSQKIDMFNQKQFHIILQIVDELFKTDDHEVINRFLMKIRDSDYMQAIIIDILVAADFYQDMLEDICKMVKNFIERFPSDSLSENSSQENVRNNFNRSFPIG